MSVPQTSPLPASPAGSFFMAIRMRDDESARTMRASLALRLACLASAALSSAGSRASAAEMREDFVYLRDLDPTILQDMRYAGRDNFTGKPVPGYDAPECVLLRPAVEALAAVQADLRAKGLALKVYDCYRPARAVAAFVEWA